MLYARDQQQANQIEFSRQNARFLPDITFPDNVCISSDISKLSTSSIVLLAVPMQSLSTLLEKNGPTLNGVALIACCKGVDATSLQGANSLIAKYCPQSQSGVLTGPSFALDIARGLPTALTIAAPDPFGEQAQTILSTPQLRLYRSTDVIGAELGGALKNIIAIAAGIAIGAGLGESARAAIITRGYAEMLRFATYFDARIETLAGLSGLGDLILTCNSTQSRNFSYGLAMGGQKPFDPTITVEGAATARAVTRLAAQHQIDMPITAMIAQLITKEKTLSDAISALLSRPLKEE